MEIIEITNKDNIYPKRLLSIKNPPQKIYALGNISLLNKEDILAIVGSRNCSEYGRNVATEFSSELSKCGITIISGLAVGIDATSHIGSLEEKGKTIAVLGSGLNNIYPKENEWLFHKILSNGGCIISEYAPNVEADTKNFPKRNRIISGLSKAVLVVEAEHRSGSTITAKYAKEQEKKIYVIPSNIYSSTGIGTNKLIKDGGILITRPYEIKNDFIQNNFSKSKLHISNSNKTSNEIQKTKLEIPKKYLTIYKTLENEPMYINQIAKLEQKSLSELNAILTIMEIEGYITRLASNQYKIKE